MSKLAFVAIAISTLLDCGERPFPEGELAERYQSDAHQLCLALSECIEDSIEKRLSGSGSAESAKREMILTRLRGDFCREGEYLPIGLDSTDPRAELLRPSRQHEDYHRFHDCSRLVQSTSDCSERKRIRQEDPSCLF